MAVLAPNGGLDWMGPVVTGCGPGYDGAHTIELLTEQVPDTYLAYLQGGGVDNGSFAAEDLIDELRSCTNRKKVV